MIWPTKIQRQRQWQIHLENTFKEQSLRHLIRAMRKNDLTSKKTTTKTSTMTMTKTMTNTGIHGILGIPGVRAVSQFLRCLLLRPYSRLCESKRCKIMLLEIIADRFCLKWIMAGWMSPPASSSSHFMLLAAETDSRASSSSGGGGRGELLLQVVTLLKLRWCLHIQITLRLLWLRITGNEVRFFRALESNLNTNP